MTMKPSCVLVVDGAADLPAEVIAAYGIHLVPLTVYFGDESFRSGIDISCVEFCQRMRERREYPTTSQPSVGEYVEAYRNAAVSGLPILSIHVSAGLSGSMNSARTARQMLPELDITMVDTGTISGGMGIHVMVAAELARQGEPVVKIVEAMKQYGSQAEMFFTLDKLDYLRKGGRIGRVAGAVGALLGIRPVVAVDKSTGTYLPAGKARSYRGAVNEMLELVVQRVGEGNEASCLIICGDQRAEAEYLAENLRRRLAVSQLWIAESNPALAAHVGPDAIQIAYFPGALPTMKVEPAEVVA